MAEIIPFRGILYSPDKIPGIADVVTPPYDVISDSEQEAYYARHPFNVIRLDKSKATPSDTVKDNSYTRAAANFNKWMDNKILVQDETPALYLSSVEFDMDGHPLKRYGLIAQVRLEPFSKGIILPHEKTFSKVKTERFELMKSCHANFSPVFSIFSDKSNLFDVLTTAVANMPPMLDFKDDAGHCHKLWRITDGHTHQKVSEGFKERRLFIADGHHRYETALNYRQWINQKHPGLSSHHPSNYMMMYLCSIQDPGLIILPAHRLLSDILKPMRNDFLKKAADYFIIQSFLFSPDNPEKTSGMLKEAMKAEPDEHKIGVLIKDSPDFRVLTLKQGIMDRLFSKTIEAPLRELDVTVLTRLILVHILEFNDETLDSEQVINFASRDKDAVSAIGNGLYDMAFILNPTTNEQVRKIAEKGLTMPRKSTYYYPKAVTGMVMSTLRD